MKLSAAVPIIFFFQAVLVSSWDYDPRCGPPINRMLEEEPHDGDDDSDTAWDRRIAVDLTIKRSLRGNTSNMTISRQLNIPGSFSIKMYWEVGYCWQEEYDRQRKWCWECQGECEDEEELWFQKCSDKVTQQFKYLPTPEGGRFQTVQRPDLCLTRVSVNQYRLQKCDESDSKQIIVGLQSDGQPFELKPLHDNSRCINQHHHPKAGEIVGNTLCTVARHWHTNLMEIYNPDGGKESVQGDTLYRRDPDCTEDSPCGVCEGDCDSDNQCTGDLVCFQRQGQTRDSTVPGCFGEPKRGLDYCIKPTTDQGNDTVTQSPPANNAIPLNRKVRDCNPQNPCSLCEGDCDSDNDCRENLRCFQKSGPGDVPGCIGEETSKTDFCVAP